ncbi:MAG: ArnT family glycosyltransferase [Chthoniobacterales bacterium]
MNIPLSIAPPATHRLDWRTIVMALLFAILSLFLTTAANRFPSSYHPDEPSKARQILGGEYNFHHPMLLLDATRAIMAVAHVPADADAATIAGRWASALFTAGAIFCLVLLAALLAGPLAGFVAGCLLVANHQLFELAHYFKEDPAMMLGVSVFFLALLCYDRSPSLPRAFALGAALGLAISGKYLGAIVAPLAFALIWIRPRRLPAAGLCLAGALVVMALANLPVLLHPTDFAEGFSREVDFAVIGHKGITRSVPHGVYWKVFLDSTMPVRWLPLVALLLIACYVSLALRRKQASAAEWMIALFPIGFGLLLSFFPKTNHRYFLPATAILLTLAAIGACTLSRFSWKDRQIFGRAGNPWPALVALFLCLAAQMPTFLDYYSGFHLDGRTAMADYLRQHVPAGTIIAQDKRVDLDALHLPYDFRGKLFAAEVGTIDELRAQHIEYVAVAEGDYGRYFQDKLRPTDDGAALFAERYKFYDRLFHEGEKLYECPAGTLQYLQPHIMLYRLPPR